MVTTSTIERESKEGLDFNIVDLPIHIFVCYTAIGEVNKKERCIQSARWHPWTSDVTWIHMPTIKWSVNPIAATVSRFSNSWQPCYNYFWTTQIVSKVNLKSLVHFIPYLKKFNMLLILWYCDKIFRFE